MLLYDVVMLIKAILTSLQLYIVIYLPTAHLRFRKRKKNIKKKRDSKVDCDVTFM